MAVVVPQIRLVACPGFRWLLLVVLGIQGQLVQTQRGLASRVGVVRVGAGIVGGHFLSLLPMLLPYSSTLQAYRPGLSV